MQNKVKLLILTLLSSLVLVGFGNNIPTVYRSKEEWHDRWKVPEYGENKEITNNNYDHSLVVKCYNGTFVSQKLDVQISTK